MGTKERGTENIECCVRTPKGHEQRMPCRANCGASDPSLCWSSQRRCYIMGGPELSTCGSADFQGQKSSAIVWFVVLSDHSTNGPIPLLDDRR